jgi:hypothetical protein
MSRDLADLIARSILQSLERAEAYPAVPGRPLGAFRRDFDAIAAAPEETRDVRGGLQATLVDTVGLFLAHATDHIRAIANDMGREPMPIWSPLTACRAVQESTVWMCHLLDPSISTETRLCRTASLWLDDSQPARAAASTVGGEHAAEVADYHTFKLAELAAGGLIVDLRSDRRPFRVRLGDAVVPVGLNLTEQVARLIPAGSPSPYRLSSGPAHGRPRMLELSATSAADGQLVGEGSTGGTAALTVMFCMTLWVTAWGGYFGVDVTEQTAELRTIMKEFDAESVKLG